MPASSGIRPNWPSVAPAPAAAKRGSQTVPKKKSGGGTRSKKWMVSNSIDSTMPTVVRMAMVEAREQPPQHELLDAVAGARPRLHCAHAEHAAGSASSSAMTPPVRPSRSCSLFASTATGIM